MNNFIDNLKKQLVKDSEIIETEQKSLKNESKEQPIKQINNNAGDVYNIVGNVTIKK